MNNKSEEKLLNEFIKVIDDPDKTEKNLFLICAFISGMIFGLSLWFLQAGTQTKVMVKHISKESVYERINEINT